MRLPAAIMAIVVAVSLVPAVPALADEPHDDQGPVVVVRRAGGVAEAKVGPLTAPWQELSDDAAAVAPSGIRLAVVTEDRRLLVQEGGLAAPLVEQATGVTAAELTGDRVAYIDEAGGAFVKEGELSAPWKPLATGVKQVSMSGRRIGVVRTDGTAEVKEGDLDQPWIRVSTGIRQIMMTGDRIGVVDNAASASVKQGSARAPWIRVATRVRQLDMSGPRIGVVHTDGRTEALEGELDGEWTQLAEQVTQLAMSGDRIGIVTDDATASVKEGSLSEPWVSQGTGIVQLDMAEQVRTVTAYGAACDGETDDTLALQSALNAARPRDVVELPAGRTCRFSKNLWIRDKREFTLRGHGPGSVLSAIDPKKSSLRVWKSEGVMLQDFEASSPDSLARHSLRDSAGVLLQESAGVEVRRVRVTGSEQAGIYVAEVRDLLIQDCEVRDTYADGIHITDGSTNVVVRDNVARRTGDDSFASVTYQGVKQRNLNVKFLDNASYDSKASGVTVEGSYDVLVSGNTIERSAVAGIRSTVTTSYDTGDVEKVTIKDNTLTDSPTGRAADHPAILMFVNYLAKIVDVAIKGNKVISPDARFGVRLLRQGPGTIKDITVSGNTFTVKGSGFACVATTDGVTSTVKTNTLNGRSCPTTAKKPVKKKKPAKKKKKKEKKKKKPAKKKKAKKAKKSKKGKKKKKKKR